MDLTRAGGCPGSTTGSAGRRNQHIRDHWQEGSKSVGERRHPSPIRRASPGRSLGSQPSLFRLADYTSPPCDVSEKSTAMRMWCSGSTPASQAGDRGFEPRHPLYPENQDNGSDPTMGLVTVLSMWTLPEKTWTNSLGMGTQRQGIRKHAIAPLVQRSEYRTFNPFVVVGSNPTGGTMLGTSPCISASIYYQIGCGSFFFRPRAKQGKETHWCDGLGKGL